MSASRVGRRAEALHGHALLVEHCGRPLAKVGDARATTPVPTGGGRRRARSRARTSGSVSIVRVVEQRLGATRSSPSRTSAAAAARSAAGSAPSTTAASTVVQPARHARAPRRARPRSRRAPATTSASRTTRSASTGRLRSRRLLLGRSSEHEQREAASTENSPMTRADPVVERSPSRASRRARRPPSDRADADDVARRRRAAAAHSAASRRRTIGPCSRNTAIVENASIGAERRARRRHRREERRRVRAARRGSACRTRGSRRSTPSALSTPADRAASPCRHGCCEDVERDERRRPIVQREPDERVREVAVHARHRPPSDVRRSSRSPVRRRLLPAVRPAEHAVDPRLRADDDEQEVRRQEQQDRRAPTRRGALLTMSPDASSSERPEEQQRRDRREVDLARPVDHDRHTRNRISSTPRLHSTGTWYTSRNIVVSIFSATVERRRRARPPRR